MAGPSWPARAPFMPRRCSGRWLVISATQGPPCTDRRATALQSAEGGHGPRRDPPCIPDAVSHHPHPSFLLTVDVWGMKLPSQRLCSLREGVPPRSHSLGDSARWSSGSCLCEQARGSIPQVANQTARGAPSLGSADAKHFATAKHAVGPWVCPDMTPYRVSRLSLSDLQATFLKPARAGSATPSVPARCEGQAPSR
jgi:hypothetical protein